ncbi:XRE family transcriptional regulator [Tepidicaulis sp.]|uniref:XRE family transcriptional regulator n=1 Tax=Tepidicaulis sp. TaxID=1920809 RepID=UPI003B5CC3A6
MANGAVIGPTVPFITASDRPGLPLRWVNAKDLSDWADRYDGAGSLPTLLSHLIRATHGSTAELHFPSDEGVWLSGWDGRTRVEHGSLYVPKGEAGWEISAQRSNIIQKANKDYLKRTENPVPLSPANSAYVFVTPRHWPEKDKWVKERQEEGIWHEIRAYDATDLVHWIEQTPAVGLWLANRLDKRPIGTRELDEIWEEWSLAAQWPLTEDLVLCDRDQDTAEVLRWLRDEPSILSLQATTTDEVVAFFHASLNELPHSIAASYRARCLVATTTAAARALANAPGSLILLLTDPEPGVSRSLVERGHYVLQAYDERLATHGEVRTLNRPTHEGIADALTTAGIAAPRAEALARDSARNLAVLRRLIPSAPGRLPKWAEESPPRALLAALLAGGWDEDVDADQVRLSELAERPYNEVIAALTPFVGEFDSPLQKIGSTWRIASPPDAWFLLAHNLTSADITRFEDVAYAVLGSTDPRFHIDPQERWMAPVRGVHRAYSGMLRHGIGQVLILLAQWGNCVSTVPNASWRADSIVAKLLQNADQHRWWSLSRDFRLLAEASPHAFLTAIEDSLDQSDPPIRVLFGQDEGGVFGVEYLSDLLWALETLAWSPHWLPRVVGVLAQLDAIDTKPRSYSNGPSESLRKIYLLWSPQTYATLDQRLRALDAIRKHETDTAWKLMLDILPKGHDSSTPSPMPRWRDFAVDKVESVTWGLIGRGAAEVSDRLLTDVGLSQARWSQLLDRLGDLAPNPERALATLEAAEPQIMEKNDRTDLWEKIRRVLHHHRQFPEADWSLSDEVLNRLEATYERFTPADPLERTVWLFQQSVQLPKPSAAGWMVEDRDVDAARREAAYELYAEGGITAVLALARLTNSAHYIGKALYESRLSEAEVDALLEAAVKSSDARERDVAHGLIGSVFRDRKEFWAKNLIAKAKSEDWEETSLLTIFHALPSDRWTWEQVLQFDEKIMKAYWLKVPVFQMSENNEDAAYAIRMLLGVGRSRYALLLAGRGKKARLPSALLIDVLNEAANQPIDHSSEGNDATMFQYHVAEVLQLLDERDDVDPNALSKLEWKYLKLLEHSRRPPKVLLRSLSEQPSLFVEMLRAVFKASEESGITDPEPDNPEKAQAIATQAYRLLELWDRIPGTRDDGTINQEELETWITEARSLAKEVGRENVADSRIGHMLSASPMGADGNWPAEPIREMIDLFRSKPMIDGFQIGKLNRRGVTVRNPRDGGMLERREAEKYRAWAEAISYDHPHTAKSLYTLADDYDQQAAKHDENAQRLDWGL